MTTVVWQTQLAKRFMSKGFLLLLVLRSSFSPPPGTRTLWYVSPLQRSISSLPRDSTGGIYKALTCWRSWTSPHCTRTCFLSPLLERLSQISPRSVLLLRYPVPATGQSQPWWLFAHFPKCGKTATGHLLESPTLRCPWDWPWSSAWWTCHQPLARRQLGRAHPIKSYS